MTKSVYKYAAEGGVPVGLCLTTMSACFLLSLRYDGLLILIPLLALVVPVLILRNMNRLLREQPYYGKFSALWLCGIYSIIFGTLICSLFTGVWLTFVDPGFVSDYVENAIEMMRATPGSSYDDTIEVMETMIRRHMLPNGMELVASMAWTTCFFGSILSLFLAIGMTGRRRRETGKVFK